MTTPADVRIAFPEYADTTVYPDTTIIGWIAQDAGLRIAFPEFASITTYPDSTVIYWIAVASTQVNQSLFGALYPLAVRLFAAHNITLASDAARVTARGGIVGAPSGVASSKSVGAVSVTYDTTLTSSAGAGFWNATAYGQRYWTMLRAFSSGPRYVPAPQRVFGPQQPYGFGPPFNGITP